MELKLSLCIFTLLIQVSLAVWQKLTVRKGQTVDLSCPITNGHQNNMEWKNPEGYIMFFKHNKAEVHKGLKDKRYSINKVSESEFTISISDVTFKDGGNYTCFHYDDHVIERVVELTVFDHPRMKRTRHGGRYDIFCTAEGNHYPPQIFWKLDDGPEIVAQLQVIHQDKKHISKAMLHVQSVESRVTVICLVRHPALHSQTLRNFVKIGQNSRKSPHTTPTSSTAKHRVPTEVQRMTDDWYRHETELSSAPSDQIFPSSEPQTDTALTTFPLNPVTATDSHLSSTYDSTTSVLSGSTRNDTILNGTGAGGRFNDPNMQTGTEKSSSLLVFLVACLIFGLLVVVIFFTIKLRRAHITWKKENEDSDPSEESNKSKSSQEEKNSQGQRRRGLFNMAFTPYVIEEPSTLASVTVAAATESIKKEQTSQPHTPEGQTSAIKETEL